MTERIINSKAVLFLGSGATAGSKIKKNGTSLPNDSNFFKNLSDVIGNWENAYPALHLYKVSKENSLYQTWNDLFIYRGLAKVGIVREPQETLSAFNTLPNYN